MWVGVEERGGASCVRGEAQRRGRPCPWRAPPCPRPAPGTAPRRPHLDSLDLGIAAAAAHVAPLDDGQHDHSVAPARVRVLQWGGGGGQRRVVVGRGSGERRQQGSAAARMRRQAALLAEVAAPPRPRLGCRCLRTSAVKAVVRLRSPRCSRCRDCVMLVTCPGGGRRQGEQVGACVGVESRGSGPRQPVLGLAAAAAVRPCQAPARPAPHPPPAGARPPQTRRPRSPESEGFRTRGAAGPAAAQQAAGNAHRWARAGAAWGAAGWLAAPRRPPGPALPRSTSSPASPASFFISASTVQHCPALSSTHPPG